MKNWILEYENFFTGKKEKDATFFPEGTMSKSAEEIYKIAKNKKYSPKGIGSAIKYLTYYLNRAGKGLSPRHRASIERAREMLQKDNEKLKENFHLLESEIHHRAVASFEAEMKKDPRCELVPLKYKLKFEDERVNKFAEITWAPSETYFRMYIKEYHNFWTFMNYNSLVNSVKLLEFIINYPSIKNREIFNELTNVIWKNQDSSFEKLALLFLKRLEKCNIELSNEAYESLGITKLMRKSQKFGL